MVRTRARWAALIMVASLAGYPAELSAQQPSTDGQMQPQPPNVPPAGQPRAQEQLPEAPPEQILENPPPLEKKADPPAEPKADPLPNTLPPAKKIEPRVPNT